jgi:Ca2+-binding RTX toxin-like protein
MADFNGDGAPDFLAESNYGDFQIMLNNGDGVFFKAKDGNIVNRGGNVTVADFNKDGHPDILQFVGGGPTELFMFEWEHKPTYPLVGGAKNDKLFGDAKGNAMDGLGGKDAIRSGSGNDKVQGGTGADMIDAGSGKDTLDGGLGNDKLTGGLAADRFVFSVTPRSADADKILDFEPGRDKIALDHEAFAGLGGTGKLAGAKFYAGDGAREAHDGSDRVIYDSLSGKLFYDDGLGGQGSKLIATLVGHPMINAGDVLVI